MSRTIDPDRDYWVRLRRDRSLVPADVDPDIDHLRQLAQLLKSLGRHGWRNMELFSAAERQPGDPDRPPAGVA